MVDHHSVERLFVHGISRGAFRLIPLYTAGAGERGGPFHLLLGGVQEFPTAHFIRCAAFDACIWRMVPPR